MSTYDDQADLELLLQQPDGFPRYDGYEPLGQTTRSIRLLRISLESDGRIHASIEHTSLDNPVEYEALSYCWGPPDIPSTIYIGNQVVPVRSSLHAFLHALCQRSQSLPIWVDSICIDQRNVHERNSQVSMMGEIYRRAVRVKSWIGPADVYAEYVFACVNHYQNEELLSSSNSTRAKRKAIESFQTILDRPYWKHLWVIQEMTLAQDLWIICGGRVVDWDGFSDVFRYLFSSSPHPINLLKDTKKRIGKSVTSLDTAPMCTDGSSKPHGSTEICIGPQSSIFTEPNDEPVLPDLSLLRQMSRFSLQSCEEPRDKIFGLLSIATDGSETTVDYTKPIGDILMDVVQIAYYNFVSWVNCLEPEHPHFTSTMKADVSNEPVTDKQFYFFFRDVARCLRTVGYEVDRQEYLASLSDTRHHPVIRHQLDKPERLNGICGYTNLFRQTGDVILTSLGGGRCEFMSEWTDYQSRPMFKNSCNDFQWQRSDIELLYCLLMDLGEIQLCSRVNLWLSNSYYFSIHYTRLAVLALISRESFWQEPQEIIDYLESTRRGLPRPNLCTCEVSPEINRRAFVAYEERKRELLYLQAEGRRRGMHEPNRTVANNKAMAFLINRIRTPVSKPVRHVSDHVLPESKEDSGDDNNIVGGRRLTSSVQANCHQDTRATDGRSTVQPYHSHSASSSKARSGQAGHFRLLKAAFAHLTGKRVGSPREKR